MKRIHFMIEKIGSISKELSEIIRNVMIEIINSKDPQRILTYLPELTIDLKTFDTKLKHLQKLLM